MAKMCAFCPADAVEKGGEHIWDNWINKALPKMMYRATEHLAPDAPIIRYDTPSLSKQFPVVCDRCNNGWMSVLTDKFKQTFSRTVLDGEPFTLSPRDAALLVSFTFMKAVVTSHGIDDEPFFTRAARETFRTSQAIPPGIKGWFAAFEGISRMNTKNNILIVSSDEGILRGKEFLSYSYVVGKLVIQLVAPRWKNVTDRGKPLVSLSPAAWWNDSVTRFWPGDGNLVLWPPSKHFADDTIQIFIDRFSNPVNL